MKKRYRRLIAAVLVLVCASSVSASAAVSSDAELLLGSYLRLMLAKQVPAQAAALGKQLVAEDAAQLSAYAARWAQDEIKNIRVDLSARFEASARQRFQQFVSSFTSAAQQKDQAYLRELAGALNLSPVPADYSELQRQMVGGQLDEVVSKESELLSDLETWTDLRVRGVDSPPLDAWLARGEPVSSPVAGGAAVPAGGAYDALRAAEAGSPSIPAGPEVVESPMDSFSSLRKARRERVLTEAKAGMQQVAAERKAAEEAYAQKKLAAAQAEAQAMKSQAEELAAVEQQAMEQRQRSWSNRLKGLVGTAAGAFGGAFLGGIGSRAGEEAITAVWPNY